MQKIQARAQAEDAWVVMTQKDAVKWPAHSAIYFLKIKINWKSGQNFLKEMLERI